MSKAVYKTRAAQLQGYMWSKKMTDTFVKFKKEDKVCTSRGFGKMLTTDNSGSLWTINTVELEDGTRLDLHNVQISKVKIDYGFRVGQTVIFDGARGYIKEYYNFCQGSTCIRPGIGFKVEMRDGGDLLFYSDGTPRIMFKSIKTKLELYE